MVYFKSKHIVRQMKFYAADYGKEIKMETRKFLSRRILCISLCAAMILGVFAGVFVHLASAATTVTVVTGSDYQPSGKTQPSAYTDALISSLKSNGVKPYGVLWCGDYSGGFSTSDTAEGINALKSKISNAYGSVNQMIFAQGNHDPAASVGLTSSGAHDTEYYGVFVLNDDDYGWYNGDPNDMSTGMGGHLSTIQKSAANLRAYFAEKAMNGYDKPIFIAAHIPLHSSLRTRAYNDGQYAKYIVDALNEGGALGLNIIYLYGHNHSGRSDDYIGGGSVYLTRGDTMFVSQVGNSKAVPMAVPLRFTYMTAGYLGYCANSNPGGNQLSMAVFEITGNEVVVKRCGASGFINVGAQGSWWETEENCNTYGTTDDYLKPATGKQMKLTSNYAGWNTVDANSYETSYVQTTSFTNGGVYVIADKNTAGTANAVKYAAGDTSTQSVNVVVKDGVAYLTNADANVEWMWTSVSGDYGTLQGTAGGRFLQIVGQDGGHLRTSSSYTETENGTRYSVWKMSGTAGYGLYSYVYGSGYSNNAARSFLRSNGTGFVSHSNANALSSGTSQVYIFRKNTVASLSSASAKVEGIRSFFVPCTESWSANANKIKKAITVTVKADGVEKVVTDYTFGTTPDLSKSGNQIVPIYYGGAIIGGVIVKVSTMAEAIAFNPTYYAEKNADLKKLYGDDSMELYKHFVAFGIKEGRETSPIFNIKHYLTKNADLTDAFGTDNVKAYEHFCSTGYKEARYSAPAANLGDDFCATINLSYTPLSLGVSGGDVVTVTNDKAVTWHFERLSSGLYKITDSSNGKALDLHGGYCANGTNIQTYDYNGTHAQLWFLFDNNNGTYSIRPFNGSAWFMDIPAASTEAGTSVKTYMYNGSAAQGFVISAIDSDFEISAGSGYSLKDNNIIGVKEGTTATEMLKAFEDSCKVFDRDGNQVTNGKICSGYILRKYSGSFVVSTAVINISGDCDGDGKVTAKDVIRAKKKSALSSTELYFYAADLNGDGKVNSSDIKLIAEITVN